MNLISPTLLFSMHPNLLVFLWKQIPTNVLKKLHRGTQERVISTIRHVGTRFARGYLYDQSI